MTDRDARILELVADADGYALSIAARIKRRQYWLPMDEIVDAARFGLVVSALRFRDDGTAKLTTYAHSFMWRTGVRYTRERAARGFTHPQVGEWFTMNQPKPFEDDEVREALLRSDPELCDSTGVFWDRVLKPLPARERELVNRVYRGGETVTDVSRSWGVTRERARQIETRALERLRKHLNADDVERLCREVSSNGG